MLLEFGPECGFLDLQEATNFAPILLGEPCAITVFDDQPPDVPVVLKKLRRKEAWTAEDEGCERLGDVVALMDDALNGQDLDGRALKVNEAMDKPRRDDNRW